MRKVSFYLVIILGVLLISARAEAVFYDVIDITHYGGISGLRINEFGNISGTTADSDFGNNRAFFWDGSVHDIYAPQGGITIGYGLNDLNQVVGTFQDSSAFIYDGVIQSLNIGRLDQFIPYDINNQGVVVGEGADQFYHSDTRAYQLTNGNAVDLGTFRDHSTAYAINEQGQIVGDTTTTGDPVTRAFIYDNNLMSLLPVGSHARDINEEGDIVGDGGVNNRGFIYRLESGTIEYINNPHGLLMAAYGINESKQVVGSLYTPEKEKNQRAYLYDSELFDLNNFIATDSEWVLASAEDINDKGQIVGWGYYQDMQRVFLLNPQPNAVPEPATMLLFGTGLAGAFIGRKYS